MRRSSKDSFESAILETWHALYAELRKRRRGCPPVRIHHAPLNPQRFTAQDVRTHVLKDMYLRFLWLQGKDGISVPQWDAYAPGTERPDDNASDFADLRRRYAHQVRERMAEQRRYLMDCGILADWDAAQNLTFARQDGRLFGLIRQLQESGYLARQEHPGHWCIRCQTVVSADELDFQEEAIPALYLFLPVYAGLEEYGPQLYLLVHLRESWMYPGISGIAVESKRRYPIVRLADKVVVAPPQALEEGILTGTEVLAELPAEKLEACTCMLPSQEMEVPVVLAPQGQLQEQEASIRALVPGHDFQDYRLNTTYALELRSLLDEQGYFTDAAHRFCGIHIKDANTAIPFTLEQYACLAAQVSHIRMVPRCWACNSRVYFRNAMQWSLQPMGGPSPRRLANAITSIHWGQPSLQERVQSLLSEASDWSVTRKRRWGIPFPAIYCAECHEPIALAKLGRNVRELVARRGLTTWFSDEILRSLPRDLACSQCGATEFQLERLVLRSELSSAMQQLLHQAEYPRTSSLHAVFAEPMGRYGGWFALWLLMAVAYQGSFPSKTLSVFDLSWRSSRERGDQQPSLDDLHQLPLDALRVWAIDPKNAKQDRLQNARELLDTLFELTVEAPRQGEPDPLGTWLLRRLDGLQQEVGQAYERFAFQAGLETLLSFGERDLRAFYLPLIAPRIADNAAPDRARVLYTLARVLRQLVLLIAPVFPVLAEQCWTRLGEESSIFLSTWPPLPERETAALPSSAWDSLLRFHHEFFAEWMTYRGEIACRVYLDELNASPVFRCYLETLQRWGHLAAVEIVETPEVLANAQPIRSLPEGWLEFQRVRLP